MAAVSRGRNIIWGLMKTLQSAPRKCSELRGVRWGLRNVEVGWAILGLPMKVRQKRIIRVESGVGGLMLSLCGLRSIAEEVGAEGYRQSPVKMHLKIC